MKCKEIRLAVVLTMMVTLLSTPMATSADSVKIGFLGGFTGPIESLTPPIQMGAEMAVANINDAGGVNGRKIEIVTGDTACVDATAAANAADRLVNSEGVSAIVGALCSGSTISAANNAAVPGGVVMVSPASTSPAVTELDDNDLVFRTVPSDSYQGEALAKLLMDKGIDNIAITYINNDYGKGFSDALSSAFSEMGGMVAANEAHEDGKADYRAEIGSLASSGAEHLIVLAYADGSGQNIIRQSIEGGDFSSFVGGDGMLSDSLIEAVGAEGLEGMLMTSAGSPEGVGMERFNAIRHAAEAPESVYMGQAYDAAFLLALAMQRKMTHANDTLSVSLRAVANPPGTVIYPGEWVKAVDVLSSGAEINYEGGTGSQDFDENGDVAGIIQHSIIQDGQIVDLGLINMM